MSISGGEPMFSSGGRASTTRRLRAVHLHAIRESRLAMGSDHLVDRDAHAVWGLHRTFDGLGTLNLESDDRRGNLLGGGQDGGVLRAAVTLGPVGLVVADDEEGARGGDGVAGASDDAGACWLGEVEVRDEHEVVALSGRRVPG